MLGNIVFTLFRTDDDAVKKLLDWIDDNIKYEKRSIGQHENASRHHVHIALTNVKLPKVQDVRKYYNRNGLKDIIPNLNAKELKLSVYSEKDDKFDVKKCLAYPLKEYYELEEIKYREYINIDEQELEAYRIFSNEIYKASQYKKDREQEYTEKNNNRQVQLFSYLDKRLYKEAYEQVYMEEIGHPVDMMKDSWIKPENIKQIYVRIYMWICEYNSDIEDKQCWRWSDIPNQVYSFMFNHKEFDKVQIICLREKIKL